MTWFLLAKNAKIIQRYDRAICVLYRTCGVKSSIFENLEERYFGKIKV